MINKPFTQEEIENLFESKKMKKEYEMRLFEDMKITGVNNEKIQEKIAELRPKWEHKLKKRFIQEDKDATEYCVKLRIYNHLRSMAVIKLM